MLGKTSKQANKITWLKVSMIWLICSIITSINKHDP